MPQSKTVFINRCFPPDDSATSWLLADVARNLAARGRSVHVIAGLRPSDNQDAEDALTENHDGVVVHRIAELSGNAVGDKASSGGRSSPYAPVGGFLKRLAADGDTVVAMTDPPLLPVLAAEVARRQKARLVNWQQDIYPEAMLASGAAPQGGRALSHLRDAALRAAVANVAVGERIAETLAERGAPFETIHVIPNWTNDSVVRPVAAADNAIRRDWGLTDCFVVGYSGNLGHGHEMDTVLSAATVLRHRTDIRFLFVGGGHHRPALEQEVARRGLTSFVFKPYQPMEVLAQTLSVPDVHWLSLRPEMEGLIFPSKFYGILAAARPLIAVAAHNGEIARLVARHRCGFVVEPGDGNEFAKAVSTLAADRAAREEMGRRARKVLETHFSRAAALRRWDKLFDAIGA